MSTNETTAASPLCNLCRGTGTTWRINYWRGVRRGHCVPMQAHERVVIVRGDADEVSNG